MEEQKLDEIQSNIKSIEQPQIEPAVVPNGLSFADKVSQQQTQFVDDCGKKKVSEQIESNRIVDKVQEDDETPRKSDSHCDQEDRN